MPERAATGAERPRRADAKRNLDALVEAAKAVFATSGVEAPAKEITDRAGVGVGTLYRHFPTRSDLVKAVLEHEIDSCADAGPALSAANEPGEALEKWLLRYTELLATKQGLAAALHKGDPAFVALVDHFLARLGPVTDSLLGAATDSGDIRADISAKDLLYAVALLCLPAPGEGPEYNRRMVAILVDGLRYGAQVRAERG
jgi:AcrR family transcriptional regulator